MFSTCSPLDRRRRWTKRNASPIGRLNILKRLNVEISENLLRVSPQFLVKIFLMINWDPEGSPSKLVKFFDPPPPRPKITQSTETSFASALGIQNHFRMLRYILSVRFKDRSKPHSICFEPYRVWIHNGMRSLCVTSLFPTKQPSSTPISSLNTKMVPEGDLQNRTFSCFKPFKFNWESLRRQVKFKFVSRGLFTFVNSLNCRLIRIGRAQRTLRYLNCIQFSILVHKPENINA